MTFKDIVYKNFKANLRKYLAYFLCCSFSIMVFFTYSSLVFNENILKAIAEEELIIKNMVIAAMVIIGIFSIFFINYAYSSFIKSRNREFGLFLTLGLSKKFIHKLIFLENSLIAAVSLVIGLIIGTVFSRLFFIGINTILNMGNINCFIDFRSYIVTLGIFLVIFTSAILFSSISMNHLDISDLLNDSKKPEIYNNSDWYFGIIGIIFVFISLSILNDKGISNKIIPSFLICVLGIYLTISKLGSLFLIIVKRSKKQYYNHMLALDKINYRFNENKKVLFTVCLLSMLATYFIGLAYSTYITEQTNIAPEQPFDLMYIEKEDKNDMIKAKIDHILNNPNLSILQHSNLEFMTFLILPPESIGKANPKWDKIEVVSETQFNLISKQNAHPQIGMAVIVTQKFKPEKSRWLGGSSIKLKFEDENYDFGNGGEIWEVVVDVTDAKKRLLVLNDIDYMSIKQGMDNKYISKYNLINFKDNTLVRDVQEQLSKVDNSLEVITKVGIYEAAKRKNLFTLIIVCFSGILFFISAGSIVYFKLYSEIDDMKYKYKQLFMIGIQKCEIRKFISNELKLVFFTPIILGCTIGYIYIYRQTIITGASKYIMLSSLIVVFIYMMFQIIYYLISKEKIVKLIFDEINPESVNILS